MKKFLLAFLALFATFAFAAPPTGTLSGTVSSVNAPAKVTLTWNVVGASACTASGGWTGTKAVSGTQTLTAAIEGPTSYKLSCSGAAGTATLSWVPPTQNMDGSPLTDLAGYKIRYGTSTNAMTTVIDVTDPLAKERVITGLGAATWYFNIAAYNAAKVEGPASTPPVSKAIVLDSTEFTFTAEVKPRPAAVTGIAVVQQ